MVHKYALHLNSDCTKIVPADEEAGRRLREPPLGWSLEHDEHLAQFLSNFEHNSVSDDSLGCIKNYVDSIEVSSQTVCPCIITEKHCQ